MVDDGDGLCPAPSRAPWQAPFHWWGPTWHRAEPKSLKTLVDLELLTAREAGWLIDHVRAGGSVVVAATPASAGKSTLAQALSSELPPEHIRVYPRGMYEPFEWVGECDPTRTTLLVNEISPHLPIYAWGDTLRRLLALGEAGYQIIATIHADSPEEVIAQLSAYPIHATAAQIAALDVVVFLAVAAAGDDVARRVSSIVDLDLDEQSGGVRVGSIPE